MLEGGTVSIHESEYSSRAIEIDTSNILFVLGGAFPNLENIISKRLSKAATIGFNGNLEEECDRGNLFSYVTNEDLEEFGYIPEFIGRLPIITTLSELTEEDLVRICIDPVDSIVKQMQSLFAYDNCSLCFDRNALSIIAKKALDMHTGARALRKIFEDLLLDAKFMIASGEYSGCRITKKYVEDYYMGKADTKTILIKREIEETA